MAWSSAELTDSGLELLSKLINGGKLTITRAAVGSGTVAADELYAQTELTDPINAPVSIAGSKELPEKSGRTIFVQVRNSGVTEAVRMRQIGIFAQTDSESEVLLAIMQDEIGEEIPSYAEFPDFLIEFNAVLVIARTNNITVMTDSGAVATLNMVNERLSAFVEISENETPKENTRVHLFVLDKITNWFRANKADKPEDAHLLLDSGLTVEASAQPDSGGVISLCIIPENSGE